MFEELKGNKNLMLTDVLYQKGRKDNNYEDYLNMVYREVCSTNKYIYKIPNPKVTIYEVKPKYRTFINPRHFMNKPHLIPHEVLYRDIYRVIANMMGKDRGYNVYDKYNRQELIEYPYCLGADIGIETIYMDIWDKELHNEIIKKPSKIFLDIEINQKNFSGGMSKNGECPIDAVTVVDELSMESHTFLLNLGDNPLIEEFKKDIPGFQRELHESFDDIYGKFEYKLYMYNNERILLEKLWSLIHSLKRDFCLIWNMAFDIPYMIARFKELGLRPEDYMCHRHFPYQTLFYKSDNKNYDFANKKDYFSLSAYTHFIDQMIIYAGLRKSQGAIKSVALNKVGQSELQDSKINYSDLGNFVMFSYTDYRRYVKYNIKDVLLQYGINKKCHDTDNFYFSSINNCVQFKDTLKQTVSFRSFLYKITNDRIILGNNKNAFNNEDQFNKLYSKNDGFDIDDDENDSYDGAIIVDPLNNDFCGLELFGVQSRFLFSNCIDFDFTRMYPSTMDSFNEFTTCLLGKILIRQCDIDKTDFYEEDIGKEYMEDVIADNEIFMGEKWFGLPTFEEMDNQLQEFLREEEIAI